MISKSYFRVWRVDEPSIRAMHRAVHSYTIGLYDLSALRAAGDYNIDNNVGKHLSKLVVDHAECNPF
jgi:hypothetical protein